MTEAKDGRALGMRVRIKSENKDEGDIFDGYHLGN